MSSVQTHPEEGLLLRYLDGEAPARKLRQVKRHLEACWECRTAAEELEGTIAACVHYRKDVLAAHLPAPPAPWADLSREFDRIDAEAAAHSFSARLARWLMPTPAIRWALSGAAVVALAAGLYYQFHETPSVQAAGLLKRAVVAAHAHPARARRIQVRTRSARFVMTDNRMAPVVAKMFDAARYSSDDPLSARSFEAWRETLPAKQDEVRTVADPVEPGKACYEIKTIAAGGELATASLMLRTTDLQPVEGRFEFRNQEWVELTDFTEASVTEGGTPATTRLEAPVRRTEPSRSAAVPSGSSASISEELRVLAALHDIGADLGDPVEVKLADGRVLVSGVGISAERQRQIHEKLDSLPGVTVQFGAAEVGQDVPSGNPPQAVAEAPKDARLQSRLEKHLGGRVELERFSGQMLDWTEAAMAHAYALRALAQRFPAASEAAGMAPADRQLLDDLARNHAANFATRIDGLHRTLAPVLVSLGGATAQGRPANSHSDWQSAAEDAVRAGRRVEMLLSQLFGMAPETASAQNLPTELLAALAELRADLGECQKALK
jgi:hypothetical protein